MSVKSTLDAIDLIAARCRIWAQSLLTLVAGFELFDLTGSLDDLIPAGSRWHKIIPVIGILIARYTHSKQSADAVIEAKGDSTERPTPTKSMGALPTVVLLLVASLSFAGCGVPEPRAPLPAQRIDPAPGSPPDSTRETPDATESELVGTSVATGSWQCWPDGTVLVISQPQTTTFARQIAGIPSRYTTTLTDNKDVGPTTKNLETMNCDTFTMYGEGTAYCGAPDAYCTHDTWFACAIYRKNIGQTTWHWSRSGWVDYRDAAYDPVSGLYKLEFFVSSWGAEGPNGCPGNTSQTNHYQFH